MNDKTRKRIESLRAEANEHEDTEMSSICTDALEKGNKQALTYCLEVIRYARGEPDYASPSEYSRDQGFFYDRTEEKQ